VRALYIASIFAKCGSHTSCSRDVDRDCLVLDVHRDDEALLILRPKTRLSDTQKRMRVMSKTSFCTI